MTGRAASGAKNRFSFHEHIAPPADSGCSHQIGLRVCIEESYGMVTQRPLEPRRVVDASQARTTAVTCHSMVVYVQTGELQATHRGTEHQGEHGFATPHGQAFVLFSTPFFRKRTPGTDGPEEGLQYNRAATAWMGELLRPEKGQPLEEGFVLPKPKSLKAPGGIGPEAVSFRLAASMPE